MERLAQLLSSFSEASEAYALARLEFALRNPSLPSPPPLPGGVSGPAASQAWDAVERALDAARYFATTLDDGRKRRSPYDPVYGRLTRALRELDRFARAVRWALTVEDRGGGPAG